MSLADAKNPPPTGYALLARRIGGWTSNILATTVVVVATVAVGRQFNGWLMSSPEDAADQRTLSDAAVGFPELGDPGQAHALEFGALPLALNRSSFAGDRPSVFDALRGECRAAASTAPPPAGEPGVMEARLLLDVASQQPIEQAGAWRMFQLDGPIPLVVVTHASAGRVLCWGLAFPVDRQSQQWTLFCCAPTNGAEAQDAQAAGLPAPPFGRRLMGVKSQRGGAIVMLAGEGPADPWLEYFDDWFSERNWTVLQAWQHTGNLHYGRFLHAERNEVVVATVEDGDQITVTLALAKQ